MDRAGILLALSCGCVEELLYSVLALFVALLGFTLVPFGLPGNWLIACAGLLGPSAGAGWTSFWVLLGGAAVAEAGEFVFAARATRKSGGSKWGALGALVGGFIGGFLGLPLIPPFGPLLGAGLGAFAGAVIVESGLLGRPTVEGVSAGRGAFLGVLLGRSWKVLVAVMQVGGLAWFLFADSA